MVAASASLFSYSQNLFDRLKNLNLVVSCSGVAIFFPVVSFNRGFVVASDGHRSCFIYSHNILIITQMLCGKSLT